MVSDNWYAVLGNIATKGWANLKVDSKSQSVGFDVSQNLLDFSLVFNGVALTHAIAIGRILHIVSQEMTDYV